MHKNEHGVAIVIPLGLIRMKTLLLVSAYLVLALVPTIIADCPGTTNVTVQYPFESDVSEWGSGPSPVSCIWNLDLSLADYSVLRVTNVDLLVEDTFQVADRFTSGPTYTVIEPETLAIFSLQISVNVSLDPTDSLAHRNYSWAAIPGYWHCGPSTVELAGLVRGVLYGTEPSFTPSASCRWLISSPSFGDSLLLQLSWRRNLTAEEKVELKDAATGETLYVISAASPDARTEEVLVTLPLRTNILVDFVSNTSNNLPAWITFEAGMCPVCLNGGRCIEFACDCPAPFTGPHCESIPQNWTCGADHYGSGDGCDCGCGAFDPDCAQLVSWWDSVTSTCSGGHYPDGTCAYCPVASPAASAPSPTPTLLGKGGTKSQHQGIIAMKGGTPTPSPSSSSEATLYVACRMGPPSETPDGSWERPFLTLQQASEFLLTSDATKVTLLLLPGRCEGPHLAEVTLSNPSLTSFSISPVRDPTTATTVNPRELTHIDLSESSFFLDVSLPLADVALASLTVFNLRSSSNSAVRINTTTASVTDCVFVDNHLAPTQIDLLHAHQGYYPLSWDAASPTRPPAPAIYAGAALQVVGAAITLQTSSFVNNSFSLARFLPPTDGRYEYAAVGGAVAIVSSTRASTVSLCNFTSNSAHFGGGALAIFGGTKHELFNTRFDDNAAPLGGAVFAWHDSEMIVNYDSCSFTNNHAAGVGRSYPAGGAVASWFSGTSTILSSTFVNNTASYAGGALHAVSPTLWLISSVLESNAVTPSDSTDTVGPGGCLYAELDDAAVYILSSRFNSCSGGNGGAVAIAKGQTGTSLFSVGSILVVQSSWFVRCVSSTFGGCLWTLDLQNVDLNDVELQGFAEKAGGGIWYGSQSEFGLLTLTNVRVFDCSAASGGGVFVSGPSGQVSVVSSSMRLCNSSFRGGAIYSEWPVDLSYTNFTSCSARRGGALYLGSQAEPTVVSCVFKGNEAMSSGGAVFADSVIQGVWNDTVFLANSAAYGGALSLVGFLPPLSHVFTSCVLENNSVHGSGGAGFFDGDTHVEFVNTTFRNNTAGIDGGAWYLQLSAEVIDSHTRYQFNSAQFGGALSIGATGMYLSTSAEFVDNMAFVAGGAIRTVGETESGLLSKRALVDGTFRGNVAGTYGGAICSEVGGTLELLRCTFDSNYASTGGAVFVNTASSMLVTGGILTNNTASGNGGAVAVFGTLLLTDSIISGNSASFGGGMSLAGGTSNVLVLTHALITHNTAQVGGGGLYLHGPLTSCDALMADSTSRIVNNVAVTGGGGGVLVSANSSVVTCQFFSAGCGQLIDENEAVYGANCGTGPTSIQVTKDVWSARSGASIPMQVALVDALGNVVSTDTSTRVRAVLDQPCHTSFCPALLAGTTDATAVNGVAQFAALEVLSNPGTTLNLSVVAQLSGGYARASTTVQVEMCQVGELLVGYICEPCPAGKYCVTSACRDCTACKTGGVCLSGNMTSAPGWWQSPFDSEYLIKCESDACLGGNQCKIGTEGHLCSLCQPQYGRSSRYSCTPCAESSVSKGLAFLAFGLMVLMVWSLSYTSMSSSSSNHNVVQHYPVQCADVLLKIFVGYLQVISLARAIRVHWYDLIEVMFSASQTLINPVERLISVDCIFSDLQSDPSPLHPYYIRVSVMLSLPLLAIIGPALVSIFALAVVYIVALVRRSAPKYSFEPSLIDQFWSTLFVCLFIVHPFICDNILSLFSYRDLGGGHRFLDSSMDIPFDSPSHRHWMLAVGIPTTMLFFGVLPAGALLALWYANRYRADNIHVRRKMRFLQKGYRRSCWYWEMVMMTRKLAIVAITVFMPHTPQLQCLVGTGVIMAAVLLHHWVQPWELSSYYYLDSAGLIASFATLYSGLYFYAEPSLTDGQKVAISVLVLVINLAFVLAFAIALINCIYRRNIEPRFSRQIEKLKHLTRRSLKRKLRSSTRVLVIPVTDTPTEGERATEHHHAWTAKASTANTDVLVNRSALKQECHRRACTTKCTSFEPAKSFLDSPRSPSAPSSPNSHRPNPRADMYQEFNDTPTPSTSSTSHSHSLPGSLNALVGRTSGSHSPLMVPFSPSPVVDDVLPQPCDPNLTLSMIETMDDGPFLS